MEKALVMYATRYGQTRTIAQHIAAALCARGMAADAVDCAAPPCGFSLAGYTAAALCASVCCGKHEREMAAFIRRWRADLDRLPTLFVSVSLSQAGAEDTAALPDRRAKSAVDVRNMIDAFLAEAGWRPCLVKGVAGALAYTKYNWFMRLIMKRIAKAGGASTDTSVDHEYTNWAALNGIIDEFVRLIGTPGRSIASAPVEALAGRT
jgi:menaquinone-dependent protoporphyrinogen oxidase